MLNDGAKDFPQKSFLYRVGQKIFFSKVPTGTQGHRVAPALWDTYFMFIDTRAHIELHFLWLKFL